MQLPLEPVVAAERLVFGDSRLADAPGHAVDERDVGGGQRRVTCCDVSGRLRDLRPLELAAPA
jgi:hypothetical protein